MPALPVPAQSLFSLPQLPLRTTASIASLTSDLPPSTILLAPYYTVWYRGVGHLDRYEVDISLQLQDNSWPDSEESNPT